MVPPSLPNNVYIDPYKTSRWNDNFLLTRGKEKVNNNGRPAIFTALSIRPSKNIPFEKAKKSVLPQNLINTPLFPISKSLGLIPPPS